MKLFAPILLPLCVTLSGCGSPPAERCQSNITMDHIYKEFRLPTGKVILLTDEEKAALREQLK